MLFYDLHFESDYRYVTFVLQVTYLAVGVKDMSVFRTGVVSGCGSQFWIVGGVSCG